MSNKVSEARRYDFVKESDVVETNSGDYVRYEEYQAIKVKYEELLAEKEVHIICAAG